MRILKIATAALILATVSTTAFAGTAATKEQSLKLRAARMVAALDARPDLVAAAKTAAAQSLEQPGERAVSRTDKDAFTIIGSVFIYDTDFLSDGTPITVGIMDVARPLRQDLYFSCIGSIASACRGTGRRQLEGWLLAGDGEETEEYLNFIIVTKVKK